MTAPTNLGPDVVPIPNGWRVHRDDGTQRVVLPRHGSGWAVFDGDSTSDVRNPPLGYSGSWCSDEAAAIDWARTEGLGSADQK